MRPRLRIAVSLCFFLPLTLSLLAQTQPADSTDNHPQFEVASVRQSTPGSRVSVKTLPDGYTETGLPLKAIISNAFGIRQDLISGAPAWTETTDFDIEAKDSEQTAAALKDLSNDERGKQIQLMLQALLADRFHLQARIVQKQMPIYQLVVANSGLKLKPADPGNTYAAGIKMRGAPAGPGMMLNGNGQIIAQAVPISRLALNLSYQFGRAVVDKTGLTANYDFTLKWTPDQGGAAQNTNVDSGPSLFTALEEQLGLKLVPAKGPVDTLVIDSISQPTPN